MKFNSKRKESAQKNEESRRRPYRSDYQRQNGKVFSYYSSNRSHEEEPRPRKDVFDQDIQRTNTRVRYIPTILAALLIAISLFYVTLIDVSNPTIVPLTQNSVNILNSNDYYEDSIKEIMRTNFTNRSKLTISTKEVEQKIKDKHPELDKVSVNIPLLSRRPIVQISPNTPRVAVMTSNGSYAVDGSGKILTDVSNVPESQRSSLITIRDAVFNDSKPGDIIFPETTMSFIEELKFQFSQKGIEIDYLELPAVANELHIKPKEKKYIVKFNLQGSAREQSGVYFAINDKLTAEPASIQPDEYVDVRVESRGFIK